MPRIFKTDWDALTIAAPKTLAAIEQPASGALQKGEVFEISWSSPASPSTATGVYKLGRTTTNGATGTTPAAVQMDPDGVANIMTTRVGPGTEPAYGDICLGPLALNQQATFRWVTQPGQGTGHQCKKVSAANGGMGFFSSAVGGTAFTSSGHLMWCE